MDVLRGSHAYLNLNKYRGTCVVVVDMQSYFYKSCNWQDNHVSCVKRVVDFSHDNHVPVIYLRYRWDYRSNDYLYFIDSIKPLSGEPILEKHHDDGFDGTLLDGILKDWGIKNIVLVGGNACGCVISTLLSAVDKGYGVVVSMDALCCRVNDPDYGDCRRLNKPEDIGGIKAFCKNTLDLMGDGRGSVTLTNSSDLPDVLDSMYANCIE